MASIPEQLIAQVFADPLMAGINTAVGERETNTHQAPPSVVAIPKGAPQISCPNRPGDARFSDKGRILLLRHFEIEWQCWGAPTSPSATADFTDAESCYLNLLVAARNAFHNSVQFSNEIWQDQQDGSDSFERLGTVIKVTSTIDVPVYEVRERIVTLTPPNSFTTTVTLNNDTADKVVINE